MPDARLEEELASLRRQIATLQARANRLATLLAQDAPPQVARPGWPIRRIAEPARLAQSH